jgi:hypothetical protein
MSLGVCSSKYSCNTAYPLISCSFVNLSQALELAAQFLSHSFLLETLGLIQCLLNFPDRHHKVGASASNECD